MNILVFAGLKDIIGDSTVDLDVVGKSVADVKQELAARYPQAENLILQSHFAIGQDYVSDSHVFGSTPDEIALIPPVSGG